MLPGSTRTNTDDNRFVLRAELLCEGERVVSYAIDVSPRSVFVATDVQAAVGSNVDLRLSFPRILEPIELAARIDELCDANGPGAPAGLRLAFEPNDRLDAVLAQAASAANVAPRACRVLFVEDSDFIRDVFDYGLRAFFEARGAYTVDHATTVEDAWLRLTTTAYDIVIVDYYLPEDTGAKLIERVRAERSFAGLPIVAVSVGGRDAREATLAAGADLFLDKPLVFRDLFNTLRVMTVALQADEASTNKRVLVFDDSPMVLELTRMALEASGFTVAIAADLAAFERQRGTFDPDLILIDVQMPEAFGDDVVLALREGHGVRVPILLVSSLEEQELASRAERSRAAGYVMKNAGMHELVRRCKQALEVTV